MISKPIICVGLATYKRPIMLEEALRSVEKLSISKEFNIQLVVCDNDIDQSAYSVFEVTKKESPIKTHYIIEKKRGIVHARNAILHFAESIQANYLAFFDDDEMVSPDWVESLYDCMKNNRADAVAGKTIYLSEKNESIPFLKKKKRETGELMKSASTNNVMFSLDFCKKNQLTFHSAFNDSGGSDTFFFTQFTRAGGKLIHCNEAITYEKVTKERNNDQWLSKRVFRNAYNFHITNRLLYGSFVGFLKSIWKIIYILVRLPFFKPKARKRAVLKIRGIQYAMSGKDFKAYEKIYGY